MTAAQHVKSVWSGIDVRDFGPYREAVAAALAARSWSEPLLREEMAVSPALYWEETGFEAPTGPNGSTDRGLRIIDKEVDEFVFVVPRVPPEAELWYRYEQISDWWMLAHGFYWWMRREYGDAIDPFLGALGVQIIGRTWTDPAWRTALLNDPRATLERETGGTFHPDLHVRAVEETDAHVLVLPNDPAAERVGDGAEHHASLFSMAHTWWQWLVWPRLMRPVDGTEIRGMVK
ncbi:MAG: hypothetical protein AAF264_06575 [Pseudomonadota bacterium]